MTPYHIQVNSSTSPVEFSTLGNITENSDSPGATPTGNVTVTKDEGMNYNDILQSLAARNGVILSKRHLIRLLKMHGLKRKEYADLGEVIDFIIHQMEGPGRLHGYRWMYNKCLTNGIRAKKEDVRLILAALDPDASATRRSRRLNRRQQGRAETFGGAGAQS